MTPEKSFETKVRKYLEGRGCWVLKTFSNGIQRAGVPDLLICHRGRFIAMEVKAVGGKFPREEELQPWNIRKINEAGGIAGILIPREGVVGFKRYLAKHHPDYADTPIYDFESFKQLIEKLEEIEEEEGQ